MRSDEWGRAARAHLLPQLPGAWGHRGALLYQKPIGWLLRYVVMQTRPGSRTFNMVAGINLLCIPTEGLTINPQLWDRTSELRRYRELPEDASVAEPVMRQVADAVVDEVVPYFVEQGNLNSFLTATEAEATDPSKSLDFNVREELFYARLLLGNVPGALEAAADAERTARTDGGTWELDLAGRVATIAAAARRDRSEAISLLEGQAAWRRKKLHLPASG